MKTIRRQRRLRIGRGSIYSAADAEKVHMGLITWKNAPDGKILKSDTAVVKNYLTEQHIKELNRMVSAYLVEEASQRALQIAGAVQELRIQAGVPASTVRCQFIDHAIIGVREVLGEEKRRLNGKPASD